MVSKLRTALGTALVLTLIACTGWLIARVVDPRVTDSDVAAMREHAAVTSGRQFLHDYLESDGRVLRRDEGGDVVSEGQAYGMLIAVAVGDEPRFRSIWDWTKDHLRRPDGLLSWRWADGRVTDANSAADADVDVARSLVIAGRRFDDRQLTEDGRQLAAAVMQTETVEVGTTKTPAGTDAVPAGSAVAGLGRAMVAGNWATAAPYVVNPGYFSPRAEDELFAITGDRRWTDLTRTQRVLSWQLLGALPPDWVQVTDRGQATPIEPPAGGPINFGLDAARLPVRFAESCDPEDRALAGAMRPVLTAAGDVPALRNLDGSAASDWQHPVALVAAAATESASDDADAAADRLDAAQTLEEKYPTYFGSAWVALGRIMLTTSLLGDCAHPA
ncbi:glycosyl hydrolase family 8 [Mycobacterium sp. URHB0044]|uniref:glycosyl hydrolase family 8 n=1 Tax=Mycobacterium sp. URHB0044 TaxID=1380386 RepID=UPI000490E96C|nr:glycosyl hydrolase family 8 [Mycobacterium sp. URHB0044]